MGRSIIAVIILLSAVKAAIAFDCDSIRNVVAVMYDSLEVKRQRCDELQAKVDRLNSELTRIEDRLAKADQDLKAKTQAHKDASADGLLKSAARMKAISSLESALGPEFSVHRFAEHFGRLEQKVVKGSVAVSWGGSANSFEAVRKRLGKEKKQFVLDKIMEEAHVANAADIKADAHTTAALHARQEAQKVVDSLKEKKLEIESDIYHWDPKRKFWQADLKKFMDHYTTFTEEHTDCLKELDNKR